MGKNIKYDELFKRYLDNTCTVEEIELLLGYFDTTDEQNLRRLIRKALSESNELSLPDESLKQHISELYTNISAQLNKESGNRGRVIPFYKTKAFIYLTAACIALMVGGLTTLFYNYPGVKFKNFTVELPEEDIAPGGNKATLTLADGKVITLNEAADGELVNDAGIIIRKTGHGQLVYEVTGKNVSQNGPVYNTVSTPKGGTYKIILPDGSRVWLNAASMLKFPSTFSNLINRNVELSGEAYFEVAKDKNHPFVVKSHQQEVKVLGTHFNISSYIDEDQTSTTLLEGQVQVTSDGKNRILKPGQQSVIDANGKIAVQEADVDGVMSWKNGLFVFDDEPLESIMKKVSRWYDVEVVYQGIDKNKRFGGSVSRFDHVSKVLRQLELTGSVHFKIEGGRIIAMK
ncbi:FecR family protein [Pedobacter frigoris]|uniref:FecR family protein n=1 Tax=Pedobacter frigoris TaxID=2571272 RepID=UPI00292D151B|nr:FecR domain-containing protein [Pedobacter frigoris]